jgi:hypothetical protein
VSYFIKGVFSIVYFLAVLLVDPCPEGSHMVVFPATKSRARAGRRYGEEITLHPSAPIDRDGEDEWMFRLVQKAGHSLCEKAYAQGSPSLSVRDDRKEMTRRG